MTNSLLKQDNRIISIADEIMRVSRDVLLLNLRFLDMALFQLKLASDICTKTMATNGDALFYSSEYVLTLYKNEANRVARDFLHALLHCIFYHTFANQITNELYWDTACDIMVENIITADIGLKCLTISREQKQSDVINHLQKRIGRLSADKIYYYFLEHESYDSVSKMQMHFIADDHKIWSNGKSPNTNDKSVDDDGEPNDGNSTVNDVSNNERQDGSGNASVASSFGSELQEFWEKISRRVMLDLESFSKESGLKAGCLFQSLQTVNREKYDYSSFLRRFSVMSEVMRVNMDEFDYAFYCYGLQLYEKMPIIEPLEYRDEKRVREFVIAIDTSGSCAGETVQAFSQKTYNILKQSESFATKINVHIIQCDADIQEDVKITSQEEFDAYLNDMKIKGLGGTDFRPVFNYVNKLIELREFSDVKGLIYFTDGYGKFPEVKPMYETAFIFLDEDYTDVGVPSWAIKLVLSKREV